MGTIAKMFKVLLLVVLLVMVADAEPNSREYVDEEANITLMKYIPCALQLIPVF